MGLLCLVPAVISIRASCAVEPASALPDLVTWYGGCALLLAGYQSQRQSGIPVALGRPESGVAMAFLGLANRVASDPIRALDL